MSAPAMAPSGLFRAILSISPAKVFISAVADDASSEPASMALLAALLTVCPISCIALLASDENVSMAVFEGEELLPEDPWGLPAPLGCCREVSDILLLLHCVMK